MSIDDTFPQLPSRDAHGHKGVFGTVSVIGGRAHDGVVMIGGPCLSALAAFRSGAGLVRLAMPEPILNAALVIAPSATGVALPVDMAQRLIADAACKALETLLTESDCFAIGPGLGAGDGPMALTRRAIEQSDAPVVIDADALNCLAAISAESDADSDAITITAPAVVTPHPGEFRRLARALGVDADPVDASSRVMAASAMAKRLGCVVVLKGARTVVSDGRRSWTCAAVNPAMATAGTGDALTGVIASLIAQWRSAAAATEPDLYDCARLGVEAHARAASLWRQRTGATGGMLAIDLIDELPRAVESLRTG